MYVYLCIYITVYVQNTHLSRQTGPKPVAQSQYYILYLLKKGQERFTLSLSLIHILFLISERSQFKHATYMHHMACFNRKLHKIRTTSRKITRPGLNPLFAAKKEI